MQEYEGKRVVGPNGERGVIRNGQIVPETPAPGGLRQVVAAPPKEPSPQTPAQARGDVLNNERIERDLNRPTPIPPGATHMLDPSGKVVPIPNLGNPDAEKQRRTAQALLGAAGVDLERGVDPIADLIKGSTSGPIQHLGAQAYGAVTGDATDGMENIARLKTVASDLTLQLTGGSLGSQISNSDREFIVERVGNIADANVPADARLAAWEQVKQRMANLMGVKPRAGGFNDPQRQQILQYLPQARDANDLMEFARRISGGTATIGNAGQVLEYIRSGGDPSQLKWESADPVQMPQSGGDFEFLGYED